MNKLNRKKQAQVIAALVEGNSISAIERMTGVAKAHNPETHQSGWALPLPIIRTARFAT